MSLSFVINKIKMGYNPFFIFYLEHKNILDVMEAFSIFIIRIENHYQLIHYMFIPNPNQVNVFHNINYYSI